MGFERATAAQIRSPTIQNENWGVGLTYINVRQLCGDDARRL
jgi:hypothetical protein